MIFSKASRRLSAIFFANFVVGSVLSSNGAFAKEGQRSKSVVETASYNRSVSTNETGARKKKVGGSEGKAEIRGNKARSENVPGKNSKQSTSAFKENEKDEFTKRKEFVERFLNEEKCLEISEKDTAAQLSVAYFYGMLKERINNGKNVGDLEKLKELERKVRKYLDYTYNRILIFKKNEEEKSQSTIDWLCNSFWSLLGLNQVQPNAPFNPEKSKSAPKQN